MSTPDTIVSRIPRRQQKPTNIPKPITVTAESKTNASPVASPKKVVKSRIPFKQKSTVLQLVKKEAEKQSQPVITSERLPQFASSVPPCSVIEGPPDRAVSFHERATSKDVIDELNRMIRKVEDNSNTDLDENKGKSLDRCCYPTGWVHVEKDIDFNDPKVRYRILATLLLFILFVVLGPGEFIRCYAGIE